MATEHTDTAPAAAAAGEGDGGGGVAVIRQLLEEARQQGSVNLNLSKRDLRVVPTEVAHLDHLETLALPSNSITTLPGFMTDLTRLRYLNLKANSIRDFPAVLCLMPSLEILDLSRNKIKKLPTKLQKLKTLRVLSVSRNRIQTIPPFIAAMQGLEVLKIEHNPLQWPPPEIANAAADADPALWLVELKKYLAREGSAQRGHHTKSHSDVTPSYFFNGSDHEHHPSSSRESPMSSPTTTKPPALQINPPTLERGYPVVDIAAATSHDIPPSPYSHLLSASSQRPSSILSPSVRSNLGISSRRSESTNSSPASPLSSRSRPRSPTVYSIPMSPAPGLQTSPHPAQEGHSLVQLYLSRPRPGHIFLSTEKVVTLSEVARNMAHAASQLYRCTRTIMIALTADDNSFGGVPLTPAGKSPHPIGSSGLNLTRLSTALHNLNASLLSLTKALVELDMKVLATAAAAAPLAQPYRAASGGNPSTRSAPNSAVAAAVAASPPPSHAPLQAAVFALINDTRAVIQSIVLPTDWRALPGGVGGVNGAPNASSSSSPPSSPPPSPLLAKIATTVDDRVLRTLNVTMFEVSAEIAACVRLCDALKGRSGKPRRRRGGGGATVSRRGDAFVDDDDDDGDDEDGGDGGVGGGGGGGSGSGGAASVAAVEAIDAGRRCVFRMREWVARGGESEAGGDDERLMAVLRDADQLEVVMDDMVAEQEAGWAASTAVFMDSSVQLVSTFRSAATLIPVSRELLDAVKLLSGATRHLAMLES